MVRKVLISMNCIRNELFSANLFEGNQRIATLHDELGLQI